MDEGFARVTKGGELEFDLHPGQVRAWDSEKRVVAIIAGTQSGKTVFGPVWYHREIQQCGPGDYMVVGPNYPILAKKAIKEFRWLFEDRLQLGDYHISDRIFTLSSYGERVMFGREQATDTNIFFGYAAKPDSLEAATAKAGWLDEAGMNDFKLGSWEAIRRRLAIHDGRVLITTTLYNLGWLVQKIWKPWQAGDPDIEVVRFESLMNPAFPQHVWEREKRDLPKWKFDLQYRGVPTRPAGMIYDNFTDDYLRDPWEIPKDWPRYIGLDFGGVNTAALYYAQDPETGLLVLYDEYKAGRRTAEQHAKAILKDHPAPRLCVGGSKSEGQWRQEFRAGGLSVEAPRISDVEVGIDRVYGYHSRGEIVVFRTCEGYLEEKATYARALDEMGQPTEKIEDKNSFHFMDAERYIVGRLAPGDKPRKMAAPKGRSRASPYRV